MRSNMISRQNLCKDRRSLLNIGTFAYHRPVQGNQLSLLRCIINKRHIPAFERCLHTGSAEEQNKKGRTFSWGCIKTALLTGAVVVGGLLVTLHNSAVEASEVEDENAELETEPTCYIKRQLSLSEAIRQSKDLMQRKKDETGSPGLVIAVTVNGSTVWTEGLGYSDVENRLACTPETIFRIASISKSITMATVAKLWENGDLDLDKPVQFYVPDFPEKTWNGEKVTVTTRQLLTHLAGIRHYSTDYMTETSSTSDTPNQKGTSDVSNKSSEVEKKSLSTDKSELQEPKDKMQLDEYFITRNYPSVSESLGIFKDDPLVNKPGSKFLYTTHGWTLVSAVVEKAAEMSFEKYLKKTLDELGMENTYMEDHQQLIYNRGRHYVKSKKGRLVNAPYVDLSYKWAGGGLISNVLDLTKFGNAMLYSYQAKSYHTWSQPSSSPDRRKLLKTCDTNDTSNFAKDNVKQSMGITGYLKPDTMKMMWSPIAIPSANWEGIANAGYGLGWNVCSARNDHVFCKDQKFFVSHTGGTIGASSVLLILPEESQMGKIMNSGKMQNDSDREFTSSSSLTGTPKGVVVAIIVNMTSAQLNKTAYDIARIFENVAFGN